MRNIDLTDKQKLTTYRRIAIASWNHPRDPSTYSLLDIRAEAALEYIKKSSDDVQVTMTHFVAKIIADCFERRTDFNHVLRMGNLYKRKTADVFITTLINSKHGKDLSGFLLRDVNSMSLKDVGVQSAVKIEELRRGDDVEMQKCQANLNKIPTLLLRPLLRIQEFVQFSFNRALGWLGLPRDAFGSVMITNIGALGIDNALIPLSPYSRCPFIIGVGKIRDEAVVKDGEVVPGKVISITMTFDHRYADGIHGAYLIRRFQKLFLNPEKFSDVFEK